MGVIIVPASGHYKNKMRHYLYFPGGSVIKKSPTKQEKQVPSLGQEDPLEREWQSTLVFLGFPYGSTGKESTCNEGDLGVIPELGRSPGEGKVYPLQYFGLENSMDCIVHRVAKSWK